MKGLNALINAGSLGAIAATLSLTALGIASPGWANEMPVPLPTATVEAVAVKDEGAITLEQPVAIESAAQDTAVKNALE